MKIVAFLGSPRPKGNTEILLDEALKPIIDEGHQITLFRPSKMKFSPCLNCGNCEETGVCTLKDDMNDVYQAIRDGERFIVTSPIFFFSITAQLKAMVDRCQSFWCEKYLLKKEIPAGVNGRKGLLLLVGGMKREIGYKCGDATVSAFFRTISVPKHEVLSYMNIDAKGAILQHPTALKEVFEAGKRLVTE